MPRGDKDGSVFQDGDRFIVRRRYTDLKGRRREKERYAYSPVEVEKVKQAIAREIDKELTGAVTPSQLRTFSDLVHYYKDNECKSAEYVGETKVSGLRSWRKYVSRLKPLEHFFGGMNLTAICYEDIDEFKRRRLNTRTKKGTLLTIASVDRELSLLRHLFFLALRQRWIVEHPFHRGKPLIQTADEAKRMKILTWEEEERLLSVCVDRRAHLRLPIIAAIETGLRKGEQAGLELRDIDLSDRIITVRAFNSKTAQQRLVPISNRLFQEIREVGQIVIQGDPKRAFGTACKLADITGLHWHDLRHTAITRMLHFYQLSEAEVMRISGHTNYKTFLRYVNIDRDIARRLTRKIDEGRARIDLEPTTASEQIESELVH